MLQKKTRVEVSVADQEPAMTSPDSLQWEEAMKSEIASLDDNNTWKLVKPQEDTRVLKGRWVYKIKRNTSGRPTQ
jgi:hypothetical protein